jgi:hypothetical protein
VNLGVQVSFNSILLYYFRAVPFVTNLQSSFCTSFISTGIPPPHHFSSTITGQPDIDETKAEAMTIDLCNNPEHKEPKLSMAKRIISGPLFEESWEELDAEVKQYNDEYLASCVA